MDYILFQNRCLTANSAVKSGKNEHPVLQYNRKPTTANIITRFIYLWRLFHGFKFYTLKLSQLLSILRTVNTII